MKMLRDDPRLSKAKDFNFPALFLFQFFREIVASNWLELLNINQYCFIFSGDYHTLMKMLRDDPRLSKAKDFTTGYTALHWAAKQGNLDLVKLLAGNYQVNVNVRSFGGYTPLHLGKKFYQNSKTCIQPQHFWYILSELILKIRL